MSKTEDIEVAPYPTVPHHDNESTYKPSNNVRVAHGDVLTEGEERDLRRGLHQRHISMIALAGESVGRLAITRAHAQVRLELGCSCRSEGPSPLVDL